MSLVNANIFPLLSALWLVDDSAAVSLRYVLTRDQMTIFCVFQLVLPAVFLVISWFIHVHSWTSAHLKPWTAQDVITPCSSHSCLTDPDSFVSWKTLGSGAQFSIPPSPLLLSPPFPLSPPPSPSSPLPPTTTTTSSTSSLVGW